MDEFILNTSMTVHRALDGAVDCYAEREFFVIGDLRLTYRQFGEQVHRFASAFHALGLEKGERVAVILPNCAAFAYAFYGLGAAGGVLLPINPFLRRGEIRHIISDSEAAFALCIPNAWGNDLLGILCELRQEMPSLRQIIVRDDTAAEGALSLASLMAAAEPVFPDVPMAPDDLFALMYTSGTTGLPKAAMHTHRSILAQKIATINMARAARERPAAQLIASMARLTARYGTRFVKYGRAQRTNFTVTPLHTMAGHGSMGGVPYEGHRFITMERFHPVQTLQLIQREHANTLVGTPTMYKLMLQVPNFDQYDTSSLLNCVIGGAWCPPDLAREVRRRFDAPVTLPFGATETGGGVSMTDVEDPEEIMSETVGHVYPGYQVRLVDDARQEVPRGQVGEIATRIPGQMVGYWRAPELTAQALDADGWYYTGDLGVMDEKSYLRIVGRKKEVIIRAGQNVYPAEVERHLQTHPAIEFAAVVGVPAELEGETVWAFVVPRAGAALTVADVLDHCRGKIAAFRVPSEVRIIDELPMTENLKVQKFKLRERAVEELSRRARPPQ